MNCPCDEFLAGAALAGDQDACLGRRDSPDHLKNILHAVRNADHVTEIDLMLQFVTQALIFLLQAEQVERLLDDHDQLIATEGLGQVIIGPLLHCIDSFFNRAVGGDDDHNGFRAFGFDLLQDIIA